MREATDGIPIGFKMSAQHVERDMAFALADPTRRLVKLVLGALALVGVGFAAERAAHHA